MMSSILGFVFFMPIWIVYLLFLLGRPVGDYILGGRYLKLPKQAKPAFFTAFVMQSVMLVVLLQIGELIPFFIPVFLTRVLAYFFAVYLLYNALISFFSVSEKEKKRITPLYLLSSICFWVTLLI